MDLSSSMSSERRPRPRNGRCSQDILLQLIFGSFQEKKQEATKAKRELAVALDAQYSETSEAKSEADAMARVLASRRLRPVDIPSDGVGFV